MLYILGLFIAGLYFAVVNGWKLLVMLSGLGEHGLGGALGAWIFVLAVWFVIF